MTALVIRGAVAVVETEGRVRTGDIVTVDGVVVDSPAPADAMVIDASGCVVTPGLVNAHHHLLQTAFRTLPGTRGIPMRDWLPAMASAYSAAKWGVLGFTRSLALEVAPHDILVNAICPGPVHTVMNDRRIEAK